MWKRTFTLLLCLHSLQDYDIFSYRRATVHISLYEFPERVKASLDDAEDESNLPHVVMGSGLPDDDDDDEDFALDLQQFNDAGAFEAFLKSQEDADQDEEDEEFDEDQEDEEEEPEEDDS